MFEIRIYKVDKKNKTRVAKLKHPEDVGLIAWCKMYFILKKYSIKN